MSRIYPKELIVDSNLGRIKADSDGAPISGVRLDPLKAYDKIRELLQKFINDDDSAAWTEIREKIDYLFTKIEQVLTALDLETDFGKELLRRIEEGKKLLLKPDLSNPDAIDDVTHGEGEGADYCTQWPFVAAVMRWFHDNLQIKYSQMAIGDASPYIINLSSRYSKISGKNITTEAVMEGRSEDFYGGWGFYFVRKYLADCNLADQNDDPMKGYGESTEGIFIPPGRTEDRLMVYDLNKVQDDITKGRTIAVPGGSNFQEITVHKAVVGGDPQDENDLKDYPGCVLVNLPRLKMHPQDLITNAIDNLGIGLYPTLCADGTDKLDTGWKYAYPSGKNPSRKAKLPYSPWVIQMDDKTCLPVRGENGKLIITKTKGLSGTQTDIISAVQNQDVFMLHVTDAINVLNMSRETGNRAALIPEGFAWSSLDCVALDLLCSRYCFKTVPMLRALKLMKENNWPTEFVRHVPVAYINGKNISTVLGLDSPLFLYGLYRFAEERGIGKQDYYVVGEDTLTEMPLASLKGHLGRIDTVRFFELMTQTMYYNPGTILHDLQKTIISFAKACDALTGSTLFKDIMEYFDENDDGIIDFDEKGQGYETAQLCLSSYISGIRLNSSYGDLKGKFLGKVYPVRYGDSNKNSQRYDFMKGEVLVANLAAAYKMSLLPDPVPDLFIPEMTYGRGNWPSWQTVLQVQTLETIYGARLRKDITLESLYGIAFQYADKVYNSGEYTGSIDQSISTTDSIRNYIEAVRNGEALLNFTLYVPRGLGTLEGEKIPNAEETDDPEKLYTVQYKDIW